MKKLNKLKLKLTRETILLVSPTVLGDVQGGGSTVVTKGIGCELQGFM